MNTRTPLENALIPLLEDDESGSPSLTRTLLQSPGTGLSDRDSERALFLAIENSDPMDHRIFPGIFPETFPGLTRAQSRRLQAAVSLARLYILARERNRPRKLTRSLPELAFDRIPPDLRISTREWLGFVAVYPQGELSDFARVAEGVRNHIHFDPVELYARLLPLRPSGYYLFHNHPSGDCTPSPEDRALTRRLRDISSELGVRLLGHGIVTSTEERWIMV